MADSGRQLSTQPVEMNITGQVIQCDCKRKNLYSRIHHPNEERYLLIILLFVLLLGFFCLFGEEGTSVENGSNQLVDTFVPPPAFSLEQENEVRASFFVC